jgi:hypothetical protein
VAPLSAPKIAAAVAATAGLLAAPTAASAAERLGMAEAHRLARVAAQMDFAEVFDARARVGRCKRVAINRASCRVVISGPGIRCSFTLHVKETKETWRFRARELRC